MNKDPAQIGAAVFAMSWNSQFLFFAGFLKEAEGLKVVRMYSASLEDKIYPNPLKPSPVIERQVDESKKPDQELESISLHKLIREDGKEWSGDIAAFDEK